MRYGRRRSPLCGQFNKKREDAYALDGDNDQFSPILTRPKFHFDLRKTNRLLDILLAKGLLVIAERNDVVFADEADRKFYEVALALGACLITVNLKHYPRVPFIKTPREYLAHGH
jgi:hypothetical protein